MEFWRSLLAGKTCGARLIDHLALEEDLEGGEAANAPSVREAAVLRCCLAVDLDKVHHPSAVLCQPLQNWLHHAARPAPAGREVHHHQFAGRLQGASLHSLY